MAAQKIYEYEVNGVKHTAQMDAEDADNLTGANVKIAKAPLAPLEFDTPNLAPEVLSATVNK